jgi:hypothetical protein
MEGSRRFVEAARLATRETHVPCCSAMPKDPPPARPEPLADPVDRAAPTYRPYWEYRVFHELWAVRTMLVRADDLPPLEAAERYGFAEGA